MRPKVVAVVPPSPSKLCWNCQSEVGSTPACPKCGRLQSVPDTSLFTLLEIRPSLLVEEKQLRESFYRLTKLTHPDRFATASPPEPSYALQWSTAINRAYETLRDPSKRTQYVIEQELGEPLPTDKSVPMELAETYFELQESLSDPTEKNKLVDFRKQLLQLQSEQEKTWQNLARQWDGGKDRSAIMRQLQSYRTTRRYLRSMLEDVSKKLESP